MKILQAAILALFALEHGQAQDPTCDYEQFVVPGQLYEVNNPNYPIRYPPGVQCRWIGICPDNYNCRLDCHYVDIPQTPGCLMDRLLVSRTGDPQLISAEIYCGRGTISTVSTGQRISMGLVANPNSPGGTFSCLLSAQPAFSPTPSCSCGAQSTNRVVNGQETGYHEYPSMAGLVLRNVETVFCGGVIIDKRYILTAAHCVTNILPHNLGVVVGQHDVINNFDIANSQPTQPTQRIQVSRYDIHPQFNPSNEDYDVAILTLAQDIKFSDRVGPACLPFKHANTDFTGQIVTAFGWGGSFDGSQQTNTLRKVDVTVVGQGQCSNMVSSLTNSQMCTYTPGEDSCQHISGGPILYTDPSSKRVYSVGIISHGRSCASDSPGVNMRVAQVLNWIEATTQANYCKI